MNPEAAKRLRLLASTISILLLLALLAVGWVYWRIRASLPSLDGTVARSGVSAPVTITRDAQGVPTLRAESRVDIARALGFLHGQDRFFQMDLLRRNAAGELSEVFGTRALPRDRALRRHGFRRIARQVVEQLAPDKRALLDAYVAGVNAGLASLSEKPFEYVILRETPRPWLPEDSFLVAHSMAIDLQDESATYERSLAALRTELGSEALAFFAPLLTADDAALDGTKAALPAPPSARVIDLRRRTAAASHAYPFSPHALAALDPFPFPPRDPENAVGSNAFALAGAHTATGAALVANDMHLNHGVPNVWYRASFEYAGRRITGVTLPGTPALVAGSNGHVAWGFTNAYVDTIDVVEVDTNSISRQLYAAPGREMPTEFEHRTEVIRIKGAEPVTIQVPWTIWGPVVNLDKEDERTLALRWTAHDPATTDLGILDLEGAQSVDEAIGIAHRIGLPVQNILLADRAGNVAWTLAGRIPKRIGFDGRLPVAWTFGDRKWDGYLASAEIPVVRGPDAAVPGRLWSGNQRHIGGDALARLGDGAYRRPHRAAQIRDGLAALKAATPRDLLAVQLDDRTLFLERWHKLLLSTLAPSTLDKKGRANLRSYIEKFEPRATTDAVSYRLVREFRIAAYSRLFIPLFASCTERFPEFNWSEFHLEPAFWAILEQKPEHLLPQPFATWEELLLAACDDVIHATDRQGVAMTTANWGWRNTARIRHPFSYSFPWLSGWLDMPKDPLPGGDDMPRVQSPTHGASERFVVSPGHEADGIFHMPTGQSGHPLSPYYRAGHEAWVRGEPTPFLPGKTQHTLTLTP